MNIYLMDKDCSYNSKQNAAGKSNGHIPKKFLQFPVLPSEYEITGEQNNQTVDINEYGEITLIGKPRLRTISLSSFFPKNKESFTTTGYIAAPQEYIKTLQYFKNNGECRLVMTGTKKINMLCTIESLSYGEKDGTGDIFFALEIREYKKPAITSVKNKKTAVKAGKTSTTVTKTATGRTTKKIQSMIYTVKKDETLAQIAKRETGSSANYRAIANQNNITEPDKIYAGQRLVIRI